MTRKVTYEFDGANMLVYYDGELQSNYALGWLGAYAFWQRQLVMDREIGLNSDITKRAITANYLRYCKAMGWRKNNER